MKTHISSPVSERSLVCGWYIYRPQSLVSVQLSELQLHSGHCWWPTVLTLKPTDPDREVTGWTLEMFRPVSQSFSLFRYCLQNVVVLVWYVDYSAPVRVHLKYWYVVCTYDLQFSEISFWLVMRGNDCVYFLVFHQSGMLPQTLCVCVCVWLSDTTCLLCCGH